MTECGAGGSALAWGARGPGFESRHSDFEYLKCERVMYDYKKGK